MIEINQLDLFSGIGGFHLGFERAGYKVNSYFSEIDKHAVAVYKQQFKESKYVGSVTNVRGADLPKIDLITFGSPCQDFSMAGKRQGMGGERSSLILEAIRLIGECRPRVFVWENVKGTFSSNDGEDFAAILQSFTNIGGYRLEWQLLNTSWFLPQNRERIYLVGYSTTPERGWRGVFPIGAGIGNDKIQSRKVVGDRGTGGQQGLIFDDSGISPCVNACSYKDPIKIKTNYNYKKVNETIEQNEGEFKTGEVKMMDLHNRRVQDISPCLVEPHHNAHALFDARPKIMGYTREMVDGKVEVVKRHLKDHAGTIHTATGSGGNTDQFVNEPMIAAQRGRYQEDGTIGQELEINKEGKTNTLTSVQKDNLLLNDYRIRRLTPIECERLQGFPDNHTSLGDYDGDVKPVSNTQRYKQCGNAVTVDVVKAVAERLKPIFNA